MTKQEIRKEYLSKRKELETQFVKIESLKISDILTQNFKLEGKTVHCFIPIAKNNEVDTWLLIDRIMENGKVVISKSNFKDNTLSHFYFEKETQLALSKFDILEPVGAKSCPIDELDIVLIPLLTFAANGYRVGYGGGFYDRFITELPEKTQLIGLSLFEPIDEIKDLNTFDKKMHVCITPKEIFYFD
ncbi:5-formyltetrahydrofolate cyclo-ligase [Flavobacteriales bacterium]|nr:5-formyltetrahydrofolate cyclo-ligase [Flavobacteriales bacterium]